MRSRTWIRLLAQSFPAQPELDTISVSRLRSLMPFSCDPSGRRVRRLGGTGFTHIALAFEDSTGFDDQARSIEIAVDFP
jgi:hypothetical protein